MRIWQIEEQCDYPGMALAVASVWTPANWQQAKAKAWICQADEALRGMFPNLPEVIEGPWGSLPRSEVMGAEEACSAMLDAMEGLSISEGRQIDAAFETGDFVFGTEPIVDRAESGKLDFDGVHRGQLSISSTGAWIAIEPHSSLYKGDAAVALAKIDAALEAMGSKLSQWMPCLVELADPSTITKDELDRAVALAKRSQIDRAAKQAQAPGPKRRL